MSPVSEQQRQSWIAEEVDGVARRPSIRDLKRWEARKSLPWWLPRMWRPGEK